MTDTRHQREGHRPMKGFRSTHLAARLALLASVVAALSCSDSPTAPDIRDISQLHQLHVTYDYPQLAATQVNFWAVKGRSAGADLWYHARAGATDSSKFVEFRMGPDALDHRPDGSAITVGDSVLITLTATDPHHMTIQYEPSGLKFAATAQPTLKIFWVACGDDVNYDGKVDSADTSIVSQFAIWRQEVANGPWERLPTVVVAGSKEVDSALSGFSGYALMY